MHSSTQAAAKDEVGIEDAATSEALESASDSQSDASSPSEASLPREADSEAGETHSANPAPDRAVAEASDHGAEEGAAPSDDEPGPGRELSDDELVQSVTALVFASPDPLSERRLGDLMERPEPARVRAALEVLEERLRASGLPLELRSIAGGWQILTTPEMGETLMRLVKAPKVERITAAALETLSIVAYRQPVTKAEIEAIRGVQVGPILRSLVDRGLVRVTGRADVPGHPLQYGTTRAFLERFGLSNLEELPRDAELAKD